MVLRMVVRQVTYTLCIVCSYLKYKYLACLQDNICWPDFHIDAIHFPGSHLLDIRRVVVPVWKVLAVQRIGLICLAQ